MKNGFYPALVTPFDAKGNVEYARYGGIIDALLARGVSGFYVCGSTSEHMLLSLEERRRILETVVARVDGRADVVAHIGAQRTEDAVDLARHAASLGGVSAVSSLPPIYFKYTLDELTDYFRAIADASPVPLIVYNAPALSGVAFDQNSSRGVFAHPRIVGMKYTSYDLFGLQRLRAAYPDKVFINGHDELYLNTLPLGLRCAIGSTFNFMPEKFIAIRKAYDDGDLPAAYAAQNEVNEIVEGLISVGVFRGVKGMMRLLGLDAGDCRRPFRPLNESELAQLRALAQRCISFDA